MWTSLRVRNFWGLPPFLGFYLQEPHQAFHNEELRVIPMWPQQSVGNIYYSKICLEYSFNKGLLAKGKDCPTWGRAFPCLEPPLAFLSHLKEGGQGGKANKYLWRSQPRKTGPLKDIFNDKITSERFPWPTLSQHWQSSSKVAVGCNWKRWQAQALFTWSLWLLQLQRLNTT